MRETGKRYLIYYWEQDELESFEEDMGTDLFEALEAGRRDPADYGNLVGSTDSEVEANDIASKKVSYGRGEVSIYDTYEKFWFN